MTADHQKQLRRTRDNQQAAPRKILPQALVCPPDAAGRSLKMRVLGYLCRVCVLFCTIAGLGTLLNSAFRLSTDGAALLPALLAVGLLSLILYGRWFTTLGGLALGGGLAAWYLSSQSSPVLFFRGVIDVGINGALTRLYQAGYYSYAQYMTQLTPMEEANQALLAKAFLGLCVMIIALLLVPFLIRRIRIAVPLCVTVLLIVPIFTYNLPVSNWAVTAIIAGCSALLIMWGYQRRYDRDQKDTAQSELFADLQRPTLPDQMQHRAQRKREEKAYREQMKEQKRRRRETGLVTVEEEINDYLGTAPARKKPRREPLDDMQLAAERARRKEERTQYRSVREYDRITHQTRCAMGGIAGFSVMVLILLVLLLPTAAVDGPFDSIDAIEHRVQYYREYVTATLRGNDPVLEMYQYGESIRNEQPHTTTATTQVFDEIELMRIYAQFNSPVYLQGWVGVNYADGAWSTANDDQLYRWRELYEATDMPVEKTFEDFFRAMLPAKDATAQELYGKYYGYEEYGFVAYMINVDRLFPLGSELYLPRVTSDTLRILEYRSTAPTLQPWANFFDGVAVSAMMNETRSDYSVEAFIPLQIDPEWASNVAKLITAYNASVTEILRYDSSRNKGGFRADYMNTFVDRPKGERFSLAQSYIEQMELAQRAEVLGGIQDAREYADFVYETYLTPAQSEIISTLAEDIYQNSYADEDYITETDEESGLLRRVGVVDGAQPLSFALASRRDSTYVDTYTQRHALTMAVINYLVENHAYTLEITAQADPALDGVENFLTVTKEGYCVQFASAAALLLREYGIPVRYMEGYVCSDYIRRVGVSNVSRFAGEVRDSDKHAWIEVWYDGIGWVLYETTPTYYVDLYGESSTTAGTLEPRPNGRPIGNDPVQPQPEDPSKEPEPPTEEPPVEGEPSIDVGKLLRLIGVALLIVGVLAALIGFVASVIRRAKKAQLQRTQLCERIIAHDESVFADEQARAQAAAALIRNTLGLLALFGSAPHTGELREDYAKRLSFEYEDLLGYPMEFDDGALAQREAVSPFRLGALMDAVAAEEFGHGMADKDLEKLARLYLTLHEKRAARLSAPRRFALHYVSRRI